MALSPQFAANIRTALATPAATAVTARDGTGALTTVFTAPATRSVSDAVLNSTILVTSATAAFTDADRGAPITGAGIPAGTTIVAVLSGTSVHLSQAATASGTGVTIAVVGLGVRVEEVRAALIATPAAGSVTLFVHDGTNARYYDEMTFVGSNTPSATVPPERQRLNPTNLFLPPGYSLRCAPTIASSFVVEAFYGAF